MLVAAVGLGMLATGESRAATVSLTPVADAMLWENTPSSPRGNEATIISGTAGSTIGNKRSRATLRFDLTGVVPAGAIIQSVTLSVRVTMQPSGPVNSVFELRRVLRSWSEQSLTWNERSSGNPWNAPGASASVDFADPVSSAAFVSFPQTYTFGSTSTLVADVQAWVNTPSANFGWLLKSQSEQNAKTARHFGSREGPVGNQPTLTITYAVPAAAPTLTPLAVANGELRFSFPAESNRAYVVEGRTAFGTGAWEDVLTLPAAPAATVLTVTNSILGGAKFFRVRTP